MVMIGRCITHKKHNRNIYKRLKSAIDHRIDHSQLCTQSWQSSYKIKMMECTKAPSFRNLRILYRIRSPLRPVFIFPLQFNHSTCPLQYPTSIKRRRGHCQKEERTSVGFVDIQGLQVFWEVEICYSSQLRCDHQCLGANDPAQHTRQTSLIHSPDQGMVRNYFLVLSLSCIRLWQFLILNKI